MKWHLLMGDSRKMSPEGGGGGGGADDKDKDKGGQPDLAKELSDMKAANAALLARLDKIEGKSKSKDDDSDDDDSDDQDLASKARKQREINDKKNNDSKALEAAIKFNMGAEQWLKTNQSLLPKDVADIFKAAENENFDNALEKDSAIKAGIIQSFFSVQSNLDLLTPGLKNQLEDYLKLTKTGKQEKARAMYDSIFEPAFEMLKRVKKAEALSKGYQSSSDDALIEKRMKRANKHFLGEKADA